MQGQEAELLIPSAQPGVDIVGILQRKHAEPSSRSPRRLAIIVHGLLAHKNQCYHRALADSLPIDSYRFDFRGNGDSKGDWTLGSLDNEVLDLATVVRHLHHQHGYSIDLIVAHSRGCMVSWMYLSRGEDVLRSDTGNPFIPNLTVVSGRWFMDGVLETYARFQEGFRKDGHYRWKITSAGKKREYLVYPKDFEDMAAMKEPRDYVARLSTNTQVLILHGTSDRIVPERDAHTYLSALESNCSRTSGSHQLHLIQGADHMYRGAMQPVVERTCSCSSSRLYVPYASRSNAILIVPFDLNRRTTMPRNTFAACLLFVRICQLKIAGKNISDLVDHIQFLSLEYQNAAGCRVDDGALMAILINQAMPIPEYHLVIKQLAETGRLTDYYTLASSLQDRWKQIR